MEDIKGFYKKLLENNKNACALIKSADEYFAAHYTGSPLNILTGFSGTTAEAIIDYEGKITLFVDPRYHRQADLETKGKNIEVVKMNFGESFSASIAKKLNGRELFVNGSVNLLFFEKLKSAGIKTTPYSDFREFGENKNINLQSRIFAIENLKSTKDKISQLKKHLNERYYLVVSLDETAYITNLRSFQMRETSTFKSKLLIDFSGKSILFCDEKIENLPPDILQAPICEFGKKIKSIDEKILFNKSSITLEDFNLIKNPVEPRVNYIAKLASIKEKAEIEHLKSAFFRLDCTLKAFKTRIKAGLSEYELKEIFEEELLKHGAKATSFKTILALADNSCSIHYSNYDKNKILKEGDLILLDCGGYYEMGLATDITRVFVCGEPQNNALGRKQKEIYTAVLKAFLNCYHSNAHTGADLDKIARKILTPRVREGFLFPHSLGHGIGIPVHQSPPVISSCGNKKFPLYKNMTHTIEPGLYCENEPYKFGIRLENSVFVSAKGERESFSHFEFEEKLTDRELLTKKEQKWLDMWQSRWAEICERDIKE